MDRHVQPVGAAHLFEVVEPALTALALERVARIGEALEFLQHKARRDQRAAQKPRRADRLHPAVDDDIRVHQQRGFLHGLAREAHVGDQDAEFVAVAADGQHHAQVAEGRVDEQAQEPLALDRQVGEDVGGAQQRGSDQPEQQAQRGAGKQAQRQPLEQPVRQHEAEAEHQRRRHPEAQRAEALFADHGTDHGRGDDEKQPQQVDGRKRRHGTGERRKGEARKAVLLFADLPRKCMHETCRGVVPEHCAIEGASCFPVCSHGTPSPCLLCIRRGNGVPWLQTEPGSDETRSSG